MDLTCYVHESWAPRIRPAGTRRDWMEATPERYAYRCLPLAIANAHGWEILSPCGFEAEWHGGPHADAVEIRIDPADRAADPPVSLFGAGTITFHVPGLIRTSPGWNLWVGGAPNAAKDGIAPLGGVIETDWSPYTFTMNWRFTRPHQRIRFERDEPFCFFFPVERGVVEAVRPEIRPMAENPELGAAFQQWSQSRDAFQAWVARTNPTTPAEKWQKLYYRGLAPDGTPGPADHQSKLRPEPFRTVRGAKPAVPPVCPVAAPRPDAPAKAPPAILMPGAASGAPVAARDRALDYTLRQLGFDAQPVKPSPAVAAFAPRAAPPGAAPAAPKADPAAARRAWQAGAAARQRALAPEATSVPRVRGLSRQAFLAQHYAPMHPVIIEGAIADWPALAKWTPDYLAATIGSVPIAYQGGRDAAPDFELAKERHVRRMPFDRFIATIAARDGNDTYLTAYNSAANAAALAPLMRDVRDIDAYLTPGGGMLWIGPGGTFTPLHFDLTNNLLAQVTGTKRVILLPPEETPKLANRIGVFSDVHDIADPARLARFPQARTAQRLEAALHAGDLLYIPVGWWHQLRSETFSVTRTYTNFRWPNDACADFPAA